MQNEKLENTRVKYQSALSNFNSEGQIQWSRFSAILTINVVIFTLLGIIKESANSFFHQIVQFIPFWGLFICLLWFLMTKRGFFWIKFWISRARELEEQLKDRNNINPVILGNKERKKHCRLLKTEYTSYLLIVLVSSVYFYMLILEHVTSLILFISYGMFCYLVGLIADNNILSILSKICKKLRI